MKALLPICVAIIAIATVILAAYSIADHRAAAAQERHFWEQEFRSRRGDIEDETRIVRQRTDNLTANRYETCLSGSSMDEQERQDCIAFVSQIRKQLDIESKWPVEAR